MVNPNVMYSVTGRYMEGQKVVGYHLVGEDGSQAQEGKDRIIWLIGKGLITNMRLQVGTDNEIILRGKGINLNKLPVYDLGKQQFRSDEISQAAANSKVSVAKSSVENANQMGQYRILRRIMYKNRCLGYEVQDYSGRITRKKRESVINLALEKLISNAVAQRYTRPGKDIPDIILRGIDCDLSKLPILIVDDSGKIIDPSDKDNNLNIRAAYMKSNGIVRDSLHNKTIPFKSGDYIICGANGEITIMGKLEADSKYTADNDSNSAICDDYLSVSSNYYIEVFGNTPIQLKDTIIKSWVILKPIEEKQV